MSTPAPADDTGTLGNDEWSVQMQTVCLTCSAALINKEEPIANKHFTHLIVVVPTLMWFGGTYTR